MADDATPLDVLILSPERVLYRGKTDSIVLPGEKGVFEVLPHHKRLLSRLLGGKIYIGKSALKIKRGVVKVAMNQVTVLVEETHPAAGA